MATRRSALIVANATYEDAGLQRLRAPVWDAEGLARVLGDPAIGNFEIRLLRDEPEPRVRREVAAFFANRDPDDMLLLHFSCHGIKDSGGQLYFAATDTELAALDATALPSDFVNRQMTKSRSRRIVLLLDCCYSGAFARGMLSRADEGIDVSDQLGGQGRVVLTASSAMEYAFEDDALKKDQGNPSVFTSALVRGLQTGEADRDGDGDVSVGELYNYVFEQVRKANPYQNPRLWTFDIEGELVIARSPEPRPVDLRPEVQAALTSSFPTTRLEVIPELARLLRGRHRGYALAARAALENLRDEDDSLRVRGTARSVLDEYVPDQPSSSQHSGPSSLTYDLAIASGQEEAQGEVPSVESHTGQHIENAAEFADKQLPREESPELSPFTEAAGPKGSSKLGTNAKQDHKRGAQRAPNRIGEHPLGGEAAKAAREAEEQARREAEEHKLNAVDTVARELRSGNPSAVASAEGALRRLANDANQRVARSAAIALANWQAESKAQQEAEEASLEVGEEREEQKEKKLPNNPPTSSPSKPPIESQVLRMVRLSSSASPRVGSYDGNIVTGSGPSDGPKPKATSPSESVRGATEAGRSPSPRPPKRVILLSITIGIIVLTAVAVIVAKSNRYQVETSSTGGPTETFRATAPWRVEVDSNGAESESCYVNIYRAGGSPIQGWSKNSDYSATVNESGEFWMFIRGEGCTFSVTESDGQRIRLRLQ